MRSEIFLPWKYLMDSGTEVNRNIQHTREEDKFNVELLQDDSVKNLTQKD
jgi:hypothetical protein